MAIAPTALIVPTDWTASIVERMAKVATEISPLNWRTTLSSLTSAVARVAANYTATERAANSTSASPHRLYIVGHDLAGGVAAIVAARCGIRTVTFGAPGTVYSAKRFGFQSDLDIDRSVIAVVAESSTLELVGGISKKAVKLDCKSKSDHCRRALFFVQSLQDACYPQS
jgi:hypothetical protein